MNDTDSFYGYFTTDEHLTGDQLEYEAMKDKAPCCGGGRDAAYCESCSEGNIP